MEAYFRATERHLPYGISQCYLNLPATRHRWTRPAL